MYSDILNPPQQYPQTPYKSACRSVRSLKQLLSGHLHLVILENDDCEINELFVCCAFIWNQFGFASLPKNYKVSWSDLANSDCISKVFCRNKGPHVKLDLGCQKGKITWLNPEEERMISFSDKKRSFTVCLDSARAGTSVYRLEGSAQTLLAPDSEPAGRIGCLESDCTHVTLLLQPSRSDTLEYNYTTSITNGKTNTSTACMQHVQLLYLHLQFAPSAPRIVRESVSAIVNMVC